MSKSLPKIGRNIRHGRRLRKTWKVFPRTFDVILQMRVDCSTTDRNRMPYYGAVDDIDEFTDIPYIDDGTRAHQLDIYIPHDAIMCAARNLPVYIDVHGGGNLFAQESDRQAAAIVPDNQ